MTKTTGTTAQTSTFPTYDRIIDGLTIFKKYPHHDRGSFVAEQDAVFVNLDPELVSEEDIENLAELGWVANFDVGYFRCYV